MDAISIREQLLADIRLLAATTSKEEAKIDELEKKLQKLRSVSIRIVEMVVLWRDQFRHMVQMSRNLRPIEKRRKCQRVIQTPYLLDPQNASDASCENYLIKMRHDTKDFNDLPLIRGNFNTQ